MQDDVTRTLLAAWQRIRPRLERDPCELARRVARQTSALITRPPRAWCLAIRATDTRLAPFSIHHSALINHHSHDIRLTSPDLQKLCRPIHLTPPGETLTDVARKLGTTPHNLLDARLADVFRAHHIPSRAGHPTPLLYTDRPLDPCARNFAAPDPMWSITSIAALDRIPPRIRATLTRVPVYQPLRNPILDAIDLDDLHPEHPLRDPPVRKRKSRRLPPPQPDSVWYKWSTAGHFLGTDPSNWRTSPQDPGDRPREDKRKRSRDRSARRTTGTPILARDADGMTEQDWLAWRSTGQPQTPESEADLASLVAQQDAIFGRPVPPPPPSPPPRTSQGSLQFRGWRWRCPRCERLVNLLFYPLPRLTVLPIPRAIRRRLVPSPAIKNFACEKCHRLRRLSRTDPNAWNELIAYLSAGLLYGHEVQRPSWFPRPERASRVEWARPERVERARLQLITPHSSIITSPRERKIPYTPRPNRSPSRRQPQIESLLLAGNSFPQIAATLRTSKGQPLAKGTVLWHARQIYKRHGVRTLAEFLTKLGHPELVEGAVGPKSKCPEIRRRLLNGDSIVTIAADLNVGKMVIYNQRQLLRKHGIKLSDARRHNVVRRSPMPAFSLTNLPSCS